MSRRQARPLFVLFSLALGFERLRFEHSVRHAWIYVHTYMRVMVCVYRSDGGDERPMDTIQTTESKGAT